MNNNFENEKEYILNHKLLDNLQKEIFMQIKSNLLGLQEINELGEWIKSELIKRVDLSVNEAVNYVIGKGDK